MREVSTLSIHDGIRSGLSCLVRGLRMEHRDVMVVQASEGVADIIAEEEVEITRPENTPPPPPPPPAPVVTEVLNVVEDDVELEQQDILSSEDNQQEAQTAVYTPPAVVEEEEESAQQIFTVVEEMPKFPGGDAELLKFIAKSIKYPVNPGQRNDHANQGTSVTVRRNHAPLCSGWNAYRGRYQHDQSRRDRKYQCAKRRFCHITLRFPGCQWSRIDTDKDCPIREKN